MRHQRLLLFLPAVVSVTLWTYACGDGTTEPPPDPPRPTTVTVSPATAELAALGATVQLSAQVQDQNGQVMSGATVTWASSAAAVATVDASGLVTAVANGTATITATAGEASGSATVTVAQVVSSVTVVPMEASFAALGDTVRLTAEAFDASGHTVAGAEFSWGTSDDAVATVGASGLVTAAANGTATITATAGSASGSATVTVAQVVSSVTVVPAEASFAALGDTVRLTAEAFDASGHTVAGAEFSWETSDDAVATVDASGLVTAAANGTATITATAGEASGSATVTVAQVVSSVTAVPAEASIAALGDTVRLTAEAFDANGSAVTDVEFSWESIDDAVATVSATGLVTSVANGVATITATSGEASGSATVTVAQEVSSVTAVPAEASIAALGDTLRLTAEAFDANGHAVAGAEFSWESIDESVATVDAMGLVTAIASGSVTITATSGSVSGSATVTVAQAVSSVAAVPAEASIAALGDTLRITAEAFDANGSAVTDVEFSWESSDNSVAKVDASGLVTAVANGTATITATAGEASGSATVTVAQAVSSVAAVPAEASIAALGDTLRLTAEAFDANGHAVAGAEFSWASSDDAVATVDATGLVTAIASGSVAITATSESVSGSAMVTVAQEVSAVTVVPDTATVVEGDTLRLAATVTDANGQVVTGAEFVWGSGDTTVAVVDASGLVTGVGAGQVQVTATAAGVTGRATLTVVAPVPTAVAVTPDTVVLTALGQTAQLTADVRDQLGRVMDGVGVSWSSSDATVAVVDSAGLVSAVGSGAATITATAGDASDDAIVTVMQSAGSVTVSPSAHSIAPGDTLRLVAEAYDAGGHLVAGASFTWSSSSAAVATVDPSGLVRGAGEGTATITATAGDASGTSEITVVNPDRAALVALYQATGGPSWRNNEGWLTDAPLGDWYGVTTGGSGRVTRLDLGIVWDSEANDWVENGLSGPIPAELASLASLTVLDLSDNALSGPIPPELGNLANLEQLSLGYNGLSGPIPAELASLASLTGLHLLGNVLSGPIPPELGNLANLKQLILGRSPLSGSIPPELGNLANLEQLSLSWTNLSGPIPPELGNLSRLNFLAIARNRHTGSIPPELGRLTDLRTLNLSRNALSGPVPPSLIQLRQLNTLYLGNNAALCLPETSAFVTWLAGIESQDDDRAPPCHANDVAVLRSLFEVAGGDGWTNSQGWLGEGVPDDWYGVGVDSVGRVEVLDLTANGLAGQLPASLGALSHLSTLKIGGNALTERLPLSLAALSLSEFRYADTELCTPLEDTFQAWLNTIQAHEGTNALCAAPASDREVLEVLYTTTGGPDWANNRNWLTDAPLGHWHGVRADREGRVTFLGLYNNNLRGQIPPQLGGLAALKSLYLDGNNFTGSIPAELGDLAALELLFLANNDLTGSIPAELGKLTELEYLGLSENALSGPIPPELGNLANLGFLALGGNGLSGPITPELFSSANLTWLDLSENALSGPIPAELGDLAAVNDPLGTRCPRSGCSIYLQGNNLTGQIPPQLGGLAALKSLYLQGNNFTGSIPPELGSLASLEYFHASHNDLEGPVPPELGDLERLRELALTGNPELSGALPSTLIRLGELDALTVFGTSLCAPSDPAFRRWLEGVQNRQHVKFCDGGGPPAAYLVQAVQSPEFPVPLVAGREALLRVFVTAARDNSEPLPPVRASFYHDGALAHVADISGGTGRIPTEVREGSLAASVNAVVPADVVRPGLEMVIEIDPGGTLDPDLGVAERIPETGRLSIEVREMPRFELTLVPFLWTEAPDSTILDAVASTVNDPEKWLWDRRPYLPIGDLIVRDHEPVMSSSNNAFDLLRETRAVRAMEGGTGYFMGTMSWPVTGGATGVAELGGWNLFSLLPGPTAHELGHNFNLRHAPCGDNPPPAGPDPEYPYPGAQIGAWGYDPVDGLLVPPATPDLMGYCGGWISDYHYAKALRHRLIKEGASAAAPATALLLWGGIGAEGAPFLEPAFVIDAPPALPDSAGEYRITGRTAGGAELFSLSFTMPVTADGDGSSGFAFALPVGTGWEGNLATITLDGPGGIVTLDGDSDIPMAILRDPRTGQVRGILRDPPPATQAAADAVGASAQGLEVLFSRGIPGSAAWRR